MQTLNWRESSNWALNARNWLLRILANGDPVMLNMALKIANPIDGECIGVDNAPNGYFHNCEFPGISTASGEVFILNLSKKPKTPQTSRV